MYYIMLFFHCKVIKEAIPPYKHAGTPPPAFYMRGSTYG